MTATRRGFFATLAALPAVVMGRKAIASAAPKLPIYCGWYDGKGNGRRWTINPDGTETITSERRA